MAFCQTIYNLFGMLIFFPIPFIRRIPIRGAMIVGEKTAKVCFHVFGAFQEQRISVSMVGACLHSRCIFPHSSLPSRSFIPPFFNHVYGNNPDGNILVNDRLHQLPSS